jgi:hypothetical protein
MYGGVADAGRTGRHVEGESVKRPTIEIQRRDHGRLYSGSQHLPQ